METGVGAVFLADVYPSNRTLKQFYTSFVRNDEVTELYRDSMIIDEAMLPRFTSLETWPKSSKISCWNCGGTIVESPMYLPIPTLDDVCGYYCQAPCAARHLATMPLTAIEKDNISKRLVAHCQRFYGRNDITSIITAPVYTELRKYTGLRGNYSAAEYAAEVKKRAIASNCFRLQSTSSETAVAQSSDAPKKTLDELWEEHAYNIAVDYE